MGRWGSGDGGWGSEDGEVGSGDLDGMVLNINSSNPPLVKVTYM